jgi:hypothetical protein
VFDKSTEIDALISCCKALAGQAARADPHRPAHDDYWIKPALSA